MNSVVRRISSASVTHVLLWAVVGSITWYFAALTYERLLGNISWEYFPQKEVFLSLKDHVFSIGLSRDVDTPIPQLALISHNFGFGLVVTEAVILGVRGRSWALRFVGLFCAWVLLLLTQTGLLVMAAHSYRLSVTQSEIHAWASIFIKSVHPTVAILPIVVIVLWLLIPFEDLTQKFFLQSRRQIRRRPSRRLRRQKW